MGHTLFFEGGRLHGIDLMRSRCFDKRLTQNLVFGFASVLFDLSVFPLGTEDNVDNLSLAHRMYATHRPLLYRRNDYISTGQKQYFRSYDSFISNCKIKTRRFPARKLYSFFTIRKQIFSSFCIKPF